VLLPLGKRTYLGAQSSLNITTHNNNTVSNTLLVHEQPRTDTAHALTRSPYMRKLGSVKVPQSATSNPD
jgi:hypothetical protein